jgi:maleate isomerase
MLDAPTGTLRVHRRNIPFTLDEGISHRAAIGLLVLASDHTIEHEWREMLRRDGVGFYEARIANSPTITPETLRRMEGELTKTAALIRPGERIDVLAYGCTSGTMVIGEETVFARLREARPGVACTSPITGALAGLAALGAHRIALLTPYIDSINQMMRDYIEARGVEVPVMGTFNNENDNEVARISAASLEAAILDLGDQRDVDAVFVSCTSLRVAPLIERLERKLGKPVTASNHAMAWHALRLAGYRESVPGLGRLMRL